MIITVSLIIYNFSIDIMGMGGNGNVESHSRTSLPHTHAPKNTTRCVYYHTHSLTTNSSQHVHRSIQQKPRCILMSSASKTTHNTRAQRVWPILRVEEEEEKFISSRQVQYKHTKCIQTPNIYNCLPEAARELL